MKNYLKPEVEAVELETVDIICTSSLVSKGEGNEEIGNGGSSDDVVEW